MAKILVVDDDTDHSESIALALKAESHTTEWTDNGQDALHRMLSYSYDLIICDWMMPIMSGVEICRKYRQSGGNAMFLMLTGRSQVADIQEGLEAGADDYLVKPFHSRELLARVRALVRRAAKPQTQATLKCGVIELDPETLTVKKSGSEIKLSRKEISLLTLFLKNPGRVFSISQLRSLWTDSPDASEDTVRTHIKTLRKKLHGENEPEIIVNIHGQGYQLEKPAE